MKKLRFIIEYLRDKIEKNKRDKIGLIELCQSKTIFGGRKVKSCDEINGLIADAINKPEPFMVSRFGAVELCTSSFFEFNIYQKQDHMMGELCRCAGFFPKDVSLGKRFSSLIIESFKQTDVLGFWDLRFEEYYMRRYGNKGMNTSFLYDLEPWRSTNPWSESLKGKKVLVIHPFEKSILSQYEKRKLIFPDNDVLPEFELITLKAVQTAAGATDDRFLNWFEALEYMFEEAIRIDFDVAIIGCGAYGMPLAARLKMAGRKVIHLGGVTQILFGIKGHRWDTDPNYDYIRNLYNDSWVYPLEEETPREAKSVENGCYW